MVEEACKYLEERRKHQQRVISILGNHSLVEPSENLDFDDGTFSSDKYVRLAHRLHLEFKEKLENSPRGNESDAEMRRTFLTSPAVENGFLVMGRILSYAVRAYFNYCKESGNDPKLEELTGLLRSEQAYSELVSFLATMANSINKEYEHAYGLTANVFDHCTLIPYKVLRVSEDRLIIFPFEELEESASRSAKGLYRDPNVNRPDAACPAHKVLLEKLWQRMIDISEQNPDLLPSEF